MAFFVLFEAEATQNGKRLGILVSAIIAEVIAAALTQGEQAIENSVEDATLGEIFGATVPSMPALSSSSMLKGKAVSLLEDETMLAPVPGILSYEAFGKLIEKWTLDETSRPQSFAEFKQQVAGIIRLPLPDWIKDFELVYSEGSSDPPAAKGGASGGARGDQAWPAVPAAGPLRAAHRGRRSRPTRPKATRGCFSCAWATTP